MKLIKKYNNLLFVFFIVLLFLILFILNKYRCPLRYITGIPCPLCGMTRALFHAFQFKFKEAFYYHAFWPLVVLFPPLYLIFKLKGIKIDRKCEDIICVSIAFLLLVYYIVRHFFVSPIVSVHYHDSLIYHIYKYLFKM